MVLQGPASLGQQALLLGWTAWQSECCAATGGDGGNAPAQGMVVLQLSLPLHTPTPGTPGVGAGTLVWALRCGGEVGRNDSYCRGFVSHRPEFKSRPCWLCDLGRGALPLGCSVSPSARPGNQPLWSAGQWGQKSSWDSRSVTSFPLPLSVSPHLVEDTNYV